jgi:hypothetical protein
MPTSLFTFYFLLFAYAVKLAFLAALFLSAFFCHWNLPPLMSQVAKTVRRVYREASAAWHVSSRVTERLALVLTLCAAVQLKPDTTFIGRWSEESERSQKKRG